MTGFCEDAVSGSLAGEGGPGVSGKDRPALEEYTACVAADVRLGDCSACCGSRRLKLGMESDRSCALLGLGDSSLGVLFTS